jgi:hypothetical protein
VVERGAEINLFLAFLDFDYFQVQVSAWNILNTLHPKSVGRDFVGRHSPMVSDSWSEHHGFNTHHRPLCLWPWASRFTSIAASFEWDVKPRSLVPECLLTFWYWCIQYLQQEYLRGFIPGVSDLIGIDPTLGCKWKKYLYTCGKYISFMIIEIK